MGIGIVKMVGEIARDLIDPNNDLESITNIIVKHPERARKAFYFPLGTVVLDAHCELFLDQVCIKVSNPDIPYTPHGGVYPVLNPFYKRKGKAVVFQSWNFPKEDKKPLSWIDELN